MEKEKSEVTVYVKTTVTVEHRGDMSDDSIKELAKRACEAEPSRYRYPDEIQADEVNRL